nr:DUF2007 domain-containing protein [Bacteroidota bacterium]
MKRNKEMVPVEVFAGTTWETGMVKSLLENAGINTYLNDEISGVLAPWNTAPGGAGSVKVVVSQLDYEKAGLIVAEYEKNR